MRRTKDNYYLDIAETVAERSTCLRKQYGAVLVKHDEIIATGYNGAPRGRKNCIDIGSCYRKENNIPRGEGYSMCRSAHAEANAIISASRSEMIGADLYLVGLDFDTGGYVENASCCAMCKRFVINAGIRDVIIRDTETDYRVIPVSDWIENDDSLELGGGY